VPCAAFAARPFNTDDARIVDPGGNQIEAYVKDQRGVRQTEYWLLPARNFGGGLDRFEFSIGGNYTQSQDGGDTNVVVAQVKTLLKPLETNGIGFAFSVGLARLNPGAEAVVTTPEGLFDVSGETVSNKVRYNPYLNAISSVSVLDDGAVFHFNAGATRENGEKSTIGNWGVGVEIGVNERRVRNCRGLRRQPRETGLPGRRPLLGDSGPSPARRDVRVPAREPGRPALDLGRRADPVVTRFDRARPAA
jgi:hypothetical protein